MMIQLRRKITKELNHIAIPLIIQSISGLCLGLIDQAMIGRISIIAFSAIGVIFSTLSFMAGILGYVSITFNIKASKFLGEYNDKAFREHFISSILLNTLIGLVFGVLLIIFKKPLLVYIFGFKGEILEQALAYATLMSPYLLLQLLLFNFSAIFKIKKDTKWILIGSTVSTLTNILLNYILIFGKLGLPKLGIQGAGMATLFSLLLNLSIYWIICKKDIQFQCRELNIYIKNFKSYIVDSLPLMGQELLEGSIFTIGIHAIISRIGVVELSAYLILTQINSIILMPMYMYGSATLTLTSENLGKKNFTYLHYIPKIGSQISLTLYLLLASVCLIFKDLIPNLITDNLEVITLASDLMIFIILSNLFNPMSTVYQYSMQAIGKGKITLLNSSIVNFIALFLMIAIFTASKGSIHSVFIGLFANFLFLFFAHSSKYKNLISTISNPVASHSL